MTIITDVIAAGIEQLTEYLSAHVITCLVPAFFIAGAIIALVSKGTILKYFGGRMKKWLSYSVASVSGMILAVCSCTILPMFAGIYKKGGGIGPATTFLYAGPAINLLAIALTASVLGIGLGIARAIGAILMGIVIGLIMGYLFREERTETSKQLSTIDIKEESENRSWYVTFGFFAALVAILLVAASGQIPSVIKWPTVGGLIILTVIIAITRYSKSENMEWMRETWWLTKTLIPILLIGVFVTGVIGYFMPYELIRRIMGGGIIISSFIGSIIGGLFYMPTLLEVPIVGTLFGYTEGVIGSGPALSLLLAGPSLSLPNMLVVWRTIGSRKTLVYISLVVTLSTIAGSLFQIFVG